MSDLSRIESDPRAATGLDRARNRYQETAVITADRIELVVLLYRGAAVSLQAALDHFEADRIEERAKAVDKAMAIIGELKATLDLDKGGTIAESLDRLYGYMLTGLLQSTLRKDPRPVHEVLGLLRPLEAAWAEVRDRQNTDSQSNGVRLELSA